jgi:hypothetical protein
MHNTKAYVRGWGRTVNGFLTDAYLIQPRGMAYVGVSEYWINYAVDIKHEFIEPTIP